MSAITPRVAIVTGAAQGIGYAIAHRLAKDGLDIALNDISAKKDKLTEVMKEIQGNGKRAIAVPGDVSNEDDVRNLVETTVEQLGGVDCVSNLPLPNLTNSTQFVFIDDCQRWYSAFRPDNRR